MLEYPQLNIQISWPPWGSFAEAGLGVIVMDWIYDDGGRGGDRNGLGDCVTRSIAIAAQLDYDAVYERIVELTSDFSYEDGSAYADACGYDLLSGPSYAGVPARGDRGLPNRTRLHMASLRAG
jgi:hypothetical protein